MLLLVCSTFLLVVLDLVTGQGQCPWTTFPDVHSRVVVAKVVFRGRLLPTDSDAMDKHIWKVTVDEVFKGELRDSEMQMVVGSDLDACPKVDMEVGQSYLLYLKSTKTDGSNDLTSIYYASSPPEVMTVKKVREAKKYGCRQCGNAGQYPKARLSVKKIFWSVGDTIEMTCQLDGLPAPRVTWYKNNLTVKASSNVQIISHKSSSQLIIRRADDLDGGIYSCDAANVLGSASSQQSHVIIESGALALNDEAPPHSNICEKQTLCLNGGVCYEIKELDTKFCICRVGFTGPRCQDKGPDVGIGGLDDILVIVCILLMILLLVTTFAMLFCIAKFRHDVGQHISRYFAIVERRMSHNNSIGELQLQSLQSDRKHRRSSELMESQALLFPNEDHPLRQPKTTPRTEAARVGMVTTTQASSPSTAAAAIVAAASPGGVSYPTGEAPGPAPSRPRFDSDVAKMAWLGWQPQGSEPAASKLDLNPDGDKERVPSPVVQKRLGVLGDDSWTSHKMGGGLANCSTAAATTYTQSHAVDSRVLASDSAARGRAMKGLLASRVDGAGKRGPADYDDDVNALLIELGVYVSEGGSSSIGGGDNV